MAAELPPAAFSGFARTWLDQHIAPRRKPSYARRVEVTLRVHLVPFFGDIQLSAITPRLVDQYVVRATTRKRAGKPPSMKTINEEIGVLSSMLSTAVRWGYLHANPCARVERLAVARPAWSFYTAEQSALWLDTAARVAPAWLPLFFTGFRTGARLGELCALEWQDLDLVERRMHIARSVHRGHVTTPKNGRDRWLDLSPQLAELLAEHRRSHPRWVRVFPGRNGSYLNRDNIKHPWTRITAASGLPPIRLHDMRHSCASQLVIAGVPLAVVKEILGHSSIAQTERYAHLSRPVIQSAVALLDTPRRVATPPKPEMKNAGNPASNEEREMVEAAGVEGEGDNPPIPGLDPPYVPSAAALPRRTPRTWRMRRHCVTPPSAASWRRLGAFTARLRTGGR